MTINGLRTRQLPINFGELVVDNFAGGGGASTGIEMAIGRAVDIAINHDPDAIRMHEVNHPHTKHYCESVWDIDPIHVTNGQPVGLAWFSPDCKHFSKARGGTPVSKNIRGLAWVALRWAAIVHPRIIMLENVEEFTTWGPVRIDDTGNAYPCPKRRGQTFSAFINALRRHGYQVEYRELHAHEYGTPTSRKRLFLIARRDGLPIIWPEKTHGPGRRPCHTAADIIDWSVPCPSIFNRKKPLAEATLRRIAEGLRRHVIETQKPFIVPSVTKQHRNHGKCAETAHAFIAKHYGGVVGIEAHKPFPTITAAGTQNQLVIANIVKLRASDTLDQHQHSTAVHAFLIKYYGNEKGGITVDEPLDTIPCRDRFGLVMVHGSSWQIMDISMRMLTPRELFNAQGFPADYIIEHDNHGRAFTKTAQVARCGNSVCPPVAAALVNANYADQTIEVAA